MKLLFGDCLKLMDKIPDKSVDLVLCDLPYGITANSWDCVLPFDELWLAYRRVCRHAVVLTATQPFTSALIMSNLKDFKHEWIWSKSQSGSGFLAKYRPMAKHESVCVFASGRLIYNPQMETGKPYKQIRKAHGATNTHKGMGAQTTYADNLGTRYPSSIQYFHQDCARRNQLHPSQKPVALMAYLIRTYTDPGMTVLDNCMGSGTTGVAAVQTGRNFIGMENNKKYFLTAKRRIGVA